MYVFGVDYFKAKNEYSISVVSVNLCIHIVAWKKSRFISSGKAYLDKTDNLSLAFAQRMLTSLSVDETLLLKYVNWSTNFRGLSHCISRERITGGIGFLVNANKTDFMCFKQEGAISILNSEPLKS